MSEVRALTLLPPWANAVAHYGKAVENRSWVVPSTVEMPLKVLIHAAANSPVALDERVDQIRWGISRVAHHLVYSSFVALATVTECHRANVCRHCSSIWRSHYPHDFHWVLDDVRSLPEPVPAKGRQGLWKPTPEQIEACLSQTIEVAS